ncbi:hypothetical protein CBD41_09815 [bacterium TMED181]|nr:hypothetical protein [Planctomycetota bacterium]OUW41957.1 MAG: hypothetical protein CBD41_09815 [bacterium TMED181]
MEEIVSQTAKSLACWRFKINPATAKKLIRVAAEECQRASLKLRKPGLPKLFYLSHLIRDHEFFNVEARFGALYKVDQYSRRNCLTDAHVGSYRKDQISEGGLEENSKDEESYNYLQLPIHDQKEALRIGLWRLTDAKYREAEEAYFRRKAHELTYLNLHPNLSDWEKRTPIVDLSPRSLPSIDREFWSSYVEKASDTVKRHSGIKNSHVSLQVKHQTRLFVNSDGSQIAESQAYWQLEAYLWHLSDKGDGIPWTISHFVNDPAELPDLKSFRNEIRAAAKLLEKIAAAPRFHSYSGPVLLDPIPAGLLIHEAMGHRLEGNRLRSGGEARTFADSLGKVVLPEFLCLSDHPQSSHMELPSGEVRSLVGHYRYDDEGTPSEKADLISSGKLRGFLTSRVPIHRKHSSNGHARSSHHERAISRMGVTQLESEVSTSKVELKEKLLEEVRRQNLPYGIRILNASSGETTTDAYDFQAFLGEINLAARVFPDGREEFIRGVNFVGTPLNAVQGIMAAGNDPAIDNAWCGAESGMVPVSTISPTLLIRNLELQSKADTPYTQYFYSMP